MGYVVFVLPILEVAGSDQKPFEIKFFSRFVVTSRLRGVDDGPVPPQSLEDRYCFTILLLPHFPSYVTFVLLRASILVVSIKDFKI